MQFILTLNLGNDAMERGLDIAEALRRTAHQLDTELGNTEIGPAQDGLTHKVQDLNGNTVGEWTIQEE